MFYSTVAKANEMRVKDKCESSQVSSHNSNDLIPLIRLRSFLTDTQEFNCITGATVSFSLPTSAPLASDNGKAFHTWDGPPAI